MASQGVSVDILNEILKTKTAMETLLAAIRSGTTGMYPQDVVEHLLEMQDLISIALRISI